MRFEELVLRIPGDEVRVRFHDRFTMIAGIGTIERGALADSIIAALAGGEGATELTYLDGTGSRITAVCEGERVLHHHTDGTPAPSIVGSVAPDEAALRRLMIVGADDLGLAPVFEGGDEPEELREARALFGALTKEIQTALAARQAADAMRGQLADLEHQIRVAQEQRGRRTYARLLAQLNGLKDELSFVRSGDVGRSSDRRLIAAAPAARDLIERWKAADARAGEVRDQYGDRARLSASALRKALATPAEVPSDIEVLTRALEGMEHEREQLASRLADLSASRLPEASDPMVLELARCRQDELWAANAVAVGARNRLEEQQLALGGLGHHGESPAVASRIEDAHVAVIAAERVVERYWRPGVLTAGALAIASIALAGFLPLLAAVALLTGVLAGAWCIVTPRQKLAAARRVESAVLAEAGASTYLSFQMRRVEAVIDPEARRRLELAVLDHSMALTSWHEWATGIDPRAAAPLEAEVRAYADALVDLGSLAEEIEGLRNQISGELDPAIAHAKAVLLEAVAPFGITDPGHASTMVRQQVETAKAARLQDVLEQAERAERELAAEVEEHLGHLGFPDGLIDTRVSAFERAVTRASEREEARQRARPPEEIEAELAAVQAAVDEAYRPQYVNLTAADAEEEPDLDALRQERAGLTERLQTARAGLPDIDRMADRHTALERRVLALEAKYASNGATPGPGALADVQQFLLSHLTSVSHSGPAGESVPVVFNDAFARVPGAKKLELLSLLERLSDKVQVIYLTDDVAAAAWARKRTEVRAVGLLEPIGEPVLR